MSTQGESSRTGNPSAAQHSSAPFINLPLPATPKSEYLMNDIPRGTSKIKLVNYLLAPPHWPGEATAQPLPQVQFACEIFDSQLDDELSVASIQFAQTPTWLYLLNLDPTGFPKKTPLGTLWRGVDTAARDSDGRTEFFRAAMADDALYAEALAEFPSTDVNVQDVHGHTALHWASANNLSNIVGLCLSIPSCDASLRDNDGLTAFDLGLSSEDDLIPTLFYSSVFELDDHDPQAALLRMLTVSSVAPENQPVFPGQAMFDPAKDGNSALVQALITHGVNLKATNADGQTALHLAAATAGNADVVRRLLQAGADVDATTTAGATVLMHAADEETAGLLKQWKGDSESTGLDSETAGSSGTKGKGKAVQWARPLFSDIEAKDERGQTALHRRGEAGDLDEVLRLIQRGADVNAKDATGLTALHLAAQNRHTETVIALLTNGAMIEATTRGGGYTALHFAAWNGHTETVIALLTNGAMAEATAEIGWTALHFAARNGHTETVSALLTNGAMIEATTRGGGYTALHFAAQNGHTETVIALLTNGAMAEATAEIGWTALHFAAWNGHTETVSALLTNGAMVEATAEIGWTALHFAAQNGNTETVIALLTNGAMVQATAEIGWTALHIAARHKKLAVVEILLNHEARIEARSSRGTALQVAQKEGHGEIAELLIARGAHTTTASRLVYNMLRKLGLDEESKHT